jgi:hypothetical protein
MCRERQLFGNHAVRLPPASAATVEMPVYGKPRKTSEIDTTDFHISTATTPTMNISSKR